MKEFLLAIKLIGLILSSASILGAERMVKWEVYLREKLQKDIIHKDSETFFEAIIETIKQSWQKFLNKMSTCLGFSAIIIGFFAFLIFLIFLTDPPTILTWVTIPLSFALVGGSIALPLLFLVKLTLASYARITEPALLEEINGELPPEPKPKWVMFLGKFGASLLMLFWLPVALIFLPFLIAFFIWWIVDKGIILLISWLLHILRSVLSFFTIILSQPYIWLDIQVQKRKIESTLVVLGVLISVFAEVLGYFILK